MHMLWAADVEWTFNNHFLILQNDFYSVEENSVYTLEQLSISALKNDIKHLLCFNRGLSL